LECCRGIATIKADVARKPEGVVIHLDGVQREEADGLADALIDVANQWHIFLPPMRRKVDLSVGNVDDAAKMITRIKKAGGVAIVVNPDALVLPVAGLKRKQFAITLEDGLLSVSNGAGGHQLISRAASDAAYESWAFILGQRASKRD